MPLPPFNDFRKAWVEKTKSAHGHGGTGWEFGTCLWSPTRNKSDHRIYENLPATQDGDLVLHFYEDAPFGKVKDYYFCGVSIVDGQCFQTSTEPPAPGIWAGSSAFYRVSLRDFKSFDEPIAISDFVKDFESALFSCVSEQKDSPFIQYGERIQLAQGKYLSRCESKLYDLLSKPISQQIAFNPGTNDKTPTKSVTIPDFDYENYVEGQRAKREAHFFSRNPKLVRDAKAKYKFTCQACNFQYKSRYLALGDDFIEIHHLNPLSELVKNNDKQQFTKLSQVTALCANCHRMIHRLIRKLKRSVPIEEFKKHISSSLKQ